MKPRDLNQANWDVNVAVFELPGLEVRITADGARIWFRVSVRSGFADVFVPIKDFRKALKFVDKFDPNTLTAEDNTKCSVCGTHLVEVMRMIAVRKHKRTILKHEPIWVLFRQFGIRQNHAICFRLSDFRKIIRWYNTDM